MVRLSTRNSIVFLMVALSYCVQSKGQNNSDPRLSSLAFVERADTLNNLYQELQHARSTKCKDHYRQLFFEAFPNDFQLLDSIYGYDEETGPAVLYKQAVNHIIFGFFKLDNIPEEVFAQKTIELSIYGSWDADAISYFQQGVRNSTKGNVELYCHLLSNYCDEKIRSFWHFHFDGPHPENHQEYFETLYKEVKIIDTSMAEIIKEEYYKLLANHDAHGH